ncbi:MAG: sugar phosphate isomerase/epimerase [Deltaproteobacteria bacterium]|nr:sugar phosphate isomerase/epimerase [Deltaproteobacteria bacterium]
MGLTTEAVAARVQVNIPFGFLWDGYLEIFLRGGLHPEIGLDATALTRYPPETFAGAARAFATAGRRITLHGPFQDLLPGALDDLIREASRVRLAQAFALLPVFRPAAIVCHTGYEERLYRWERDQWLDRSAALWGPLAAQAAAQGVNLHLENVYETDPALFLDLFARLDAPNVGLCFDVGHLLAFGGGDFDGWLDALWPHIGQLHLHDNAGDGDHHLALGQGKVPLVQVLEFLASREVRPLITLEPHQEGSLLPSLSCLAEIWPWD